MSNDAPEDPALDAAYRRAARAAGVPAEATRRAILAHARGLAASRAPGTLGSRARVSWARPALFGALAASVVAGLLLAPRWRLTGTAPAALAARVAPAAPAAPAEAPVQIAPSEVLPQERKEARAAAPAPAPLLAQQRKEDLPASPLGSPPRPRPDAGDTLAEPTVLGGLAAGRSAAISNTTTQHVAAAAPVPELPGAALRRAAAAGDLAQLEALSRGPPDLNARDAQGRTALLLATVNGHANAVAALLAYGADPRIADTQGVTPLAAARSAGNTEIVAILARYGVR
jgi:Ankyrin repeats (3 copies)